MIVVGALWSFFTGSSVGRLVSGVAAAAVAVVLAYGAGSLSGRMAARAECNAAALRAELAAVKRDLKIQQDLSAFAGAERDQLATHSANLDAKVTRYEKELASRPAPACAATDVDVRRLRNIR